MYLRGPEGRYQSPSHCKAASKTPCENYQSKHHLELDTAASSATQDKGQSHFKEDRQIGLYLTSCMYLAFMNAIHDHRELREYIDNDRGEPLILVQKKELD